jgi:hypothetical protein
MAGADVWQVLLAHPAVIEIGHGRAPREGAVIPPAQRHRPQAQASAARTGGRTGQRSADGSPLV